MALLITVSIRSVKPKTYRRSLELHFLFFVVTQSLGVRRNRCGMQISELRTREEMESIFPLVRQRQEDMSFECFSALLDEMLPAGYRCIGAYDAQGALVGISGFWIKCQFYCRKSIRIDNFIIDEAHRNQGIGAAMVAWLEEEGRRNDCRVALLDSYVSNHNSHKFYFREGFRILGFHFLKEL